jgi:hypothetical protein
LFVVELYERRAELIEEGAFSKWFREISRDGTAGCNAEAKVLTLGWRERSLLAVG